MSWHDQLYFSSGSTVNNWLARQARFLLFSKTNRTNQQRQWFKKVLSSCKSFLPSQKQNGPMADDFWCQTKWLISCERKVSSSDYTMLSCLSIKKYYISWQQSETVILMQLNRYKSIPCGELSLHTTGKFQWEIAIFVISPIRAGPCAALQMSQWSLSSTFSSENFCLAGSTSAWWSSPTFSLTTGASLAAVPWPPGCWHVPPPTQPIDLLCNSQQQEKVSQVVKVQHLSFKLCWSQTKLQ